MADRPILFSGPMVRALLGGRKTQTRRVLKPQPNMMNGGRPLNNGYGAYSTEGGWKQIPFARGDRLWVRESISGRRYAADFIPCRTPHDEAKSWFLWRKHDYSPSIHMPRWASRLTLIATDVRVQQLQEISRHDAINEGLEWISPTYGVSGQPHWDEDPLYPFMHLWDSLNAKRGFGWEANPWVMATTFTVLRSNIDDLEVAA